MQIKFGDNVVEVMMDGLNLVMTNNKVALTIVELLKFDHYVKDDNIVIENANISSDEFKKLILSLFVTEQIAHMWV